MLASNSPQYQQASIVELVQALSAGSIMLTSRYHAGVTASWTGSRVSVYPRNDKLEGLIDELGVPQFSAFNFEEIGAAIERSRPVSETVLLGLADRAEAACRELFATCGLC